jgi:hypothetical protein
MVRKKMTSINIFKELRTKYGTWSSLKTFLTGDEGGKLTIVENTIEPRYCIVRYDKAASNFAIPYVHAFRSVVWDTLQNIPVSVAPFKATETEPSVEHIQDSNTIVQEFVEGTMIQAFISAEDQQIRLATRTKFGAHTRFHSKRNFSELIKDAPQYAELNKILPPASSTVPYTFASVVLQHPEHRVVAPITQPRLYVVNLGAVNADGLVTISENPLTWSETALRYAVPTYADKNINIQAVAFTYGWMWQGLVVKNTVTLQRWRILNPLYTIVRELRGNESDDILRFLRLRKTGQIRAYIHYYPEITTVYEAYELKLREQTQSLFDEYCAVYKNKSASKKSLNDVGWPHRQNMRIIHDIYRTQLKPAQQIVKKEMVVYYINNLDFVKLRAFMITPVGGKITTKNIVAELQDEDIMP